VVTQNENIHLFFCRLSGSMLRTVYVSSDGFFYCTFQRVNWIATAEYRQSVACETQNRSWRVFNFYLICLDSVD